MKFTPAGIEGAFIIEPEPIQDERGFFARTVCEEEFARHGLNGHFVQQSISFNTRKGILRGLHWQVAPHEEEKLVRVTAGAIFDVIVDLRSHSRTYMQWISVELSATNRLALYIPKGVAHGFQTLTEGTEVFYEMTAPFNHEAAQGSRWDDPALAIAWPEPHCAIISERDANLPMFSDIS